MTDRDPAGAARPGRAARLLAPLLLLPPLLAGVGWGTVALAVDGPGRVAAGAFALLALAALALPRPRWRGVAACGALFAVVLVWWLRLEPRNDRDWLPEVRRLATMQVAGDRLTVTNLRNFQYAADGVVEERWEERAYDLSGVVGLDLLVGDWGAEMIVHTMLSWEFSDGRQLAVSIETRKEQGEGYSALRGFFRQFELYYVVADERDLVGVRTVVRGERVRLYRLAVTPDQARALLESYAGQVNRLAESPAWYNALDHNCTTSIRLHAVHLGIERPWDWRILVNGRGEELLYRRGMIATSLPFEELRARSDVTMAAREAYAQPEFSRLLREGLPPRPAVR